jgi:hypothetical protein
MISRLYRVGSDDLIPVFVGEFADREEAGAHVLAGGLSEEEYAFYLVINGWMEFYCSAPDGGYSWEDPETV